MRKGCLLGILRKGMSSYSSPIMLIPRKLTGIPRIVTDFRHLNSRLVTLQPSIDHEEVISYASSQVNQRLNQQQGNSKLVDRKGDDENDTHSDKEEDPYPYENEILGGICLIKRYLKSIWTCQIQT